VEAEVEVEELLLQERMYLQALTKEDQEEQVLLIQLQEVQ
jgi:hypothetical protein